MKNFWENGLSIDESRTSLLMVFMCIFLLGALYLRVKEGVIGKEYVSIVQTLIFSVAGVNVSKNLFSKGVDYDKRV